jgi:hypothetical protein
MIDGFEIKDLVNRKKEYLPSDSYFSKEDFINLFETNIKEKHFY